MNSPSTPNRFYCFPNIFDLDLESIKTYLAWKESSSTLLLPIHVLNCLNFLAFIEIRILTSK